METSTRRTQPNVIEGLVASVARHAHVDAAFVTEYGDDGSTIRVVAGDGHRVGVRLGARLPLARSLSLASVTDRIPAVVPDVQGNRVARRLVGDRAARPGAFAAAPIRLPGGTLFGALCIANREPLPHLGGTTEQFLSIICDVIADQLEGWHAEAGHERERDEIRSMLHDDRMSTLLQPIVSLEDGRTVGVEALTRFASTPERPPDLWFATAARHGLGADLELAAIDRAVALVDHLPPSWYLAVNASPAVVQACDLIDHLPPKHTDRLVVEVTEHAAVDDYVGLVESLHDLREAGVRIAVDDVGAGFSSFRHVLQLRPDLIKIDRSLIRGLDADPMHRAMVESIVAFAEQSHATGLVAEAVETPDELDVLQSLGVPTAQGYLFAAPADPADLREDYPVQVPDRLQSAS